MEAGGRAGSVAMDAIGLRNETSERCVGWTRAGDGRVVLAISADVVVAWRRVGDSSGTMHAPHVTQHVHDREQTGREGGMISVR